jgi:aspartyl-tRNA(Asn)/glutamyl-tRNA(Gln) amidotransferase subunit A
MSARELRDKVASGEIKAAELLDEFYSRIWEYDGDIGAYLTLCEEHARGRAVEIDRRVAAGESVGALAGVPVAVKDNICTSFSRTTCSSKILEDFLPPYDADVVERLERAGAVIVGKTNLDEFAMGSSTENAGLGRTVNPWDYSRVPGGSSGGSAAAMAAGLCSAAVGSDTGGSIRQPCSFCGVVGLKPTYGRVSRYGLVAYGSSLDQIGPITSSVGDSALMLDVIAGHDRRDSTSVSEETAGRLDCLANLEEAIAGLRIAIVPRFIEGASGDVQRSVSEAIEVYKKLGAEMVEVDMPHFDYAVATYYVVATAEASSNLARYDGVHYGYRDGGAEDYVDVYNKSRAAGFGSEVKRRIMLGTYALSSGYYDAYYLKGLKVRNLIRRDFLNVLEKADCIMMPVSPTPAFKIGEKVSDPLQMYLADIYTLALNLSGLPGMSLPCGFSGEGLPIGLQIITAMFKEDKLLRIARMLERETGYCDKRAELKGKD